MRWPRTYGPGPTHFSAEKLSCRRTTVPRPCTGLPGLQLERHEVAVGVNSADLGVVGERGEPREPELSIQFDGPNVRGVDGQRDHLEVRDVPSVRDRLLHEPGSQALAPPLLPDRDTQLRTVLHTRLIRGRQGDRTRQFVPVVGN